MKSSIVNLYISVESRLFFKKPTDWRPRISRDFMISVASEISNETLDFTGKVSQLPVQVLPTTSIDSSYFLS